MVDLADLRHEYTRRGLDERDCEPDPIAQFEKWFEFARTAGVAEPNAMTLATVGAEGPNARTVLLKSVDDRGFVFYTNYRSRKGRELAHEPRAALVFFWAELERQVRVLGRAQRVPREESLEYFHSRPRGAQLGAWASRQSSPIEDRGVLQARLREVEKEYDGCEVPLPPYWGGYRLRHEVVEFWQGRPNRLHDRIVYRGGPPTWTFQRLSP